MAGAHLGGRGAGRRRSCSATAAPREGARRRGHADGRHHPRPQPVPETTCDFYPNNPNNPSKVAIIRPKTAESRG